MTVEQLYDYAKKHDAIDYEIYGTGISCGPYFDRVKTDTKKKRLLMEDSSYFRYQKGFDLIPKKD